MRDRWSARGEKRLAAGQFAAAAGEFRRALARSPDNAALWLRAADCAFLAGDAKGAARAATRAHDLAGGPDFLRRRMQATLIAGDEAAARRALSGRDLPAGEAAFWRAILSCRAGRWAMARGQFLSAVRSDPARLAVRAGLLAAWAAHRAAGVPAAERGRGVVIAGLGWKRPRQATVGGLDALASCAALFVVANTVDDEVRDVLCLFRAKTRAVVFRGSETEANRAAQEALRAAARARCGTITRGNPLVYGRFAARLVAGARARGIPLVVYPGVSAFEGLAAEARPSPGTPLGFELRGGFSATDADPNRPLVIFAPSAERGRKLLAASLPQIARGKKVRVLTSEGPGAADSLPMSAARAAAALRASPSPAMLWLPSRRAP